MRSRHKTSKLLHRLTAVFDHPSIDQRLALMQSQLEKLEQGLSTHSHTIARLAQTVLPIDASAAGTWTAMIERLDQMQLQLGRLERMGHGGRATYIGNNRVLTKCVIADAVLGFLLEADDILLGPWLILSGMYELDITNYFLSNLKPDSRCLDIGANFGFFTCLMARFCHHGKVIGVEPNQHVYELMRDNIYINGLHEWATPKHAAVSDSVGTLKLYRRIKRSGNTSVAQLPEAFLQALGEPESEPFQVACLRIDDLLSEFDNRIDFIKIDVEGAEPLAMRGARQTILANPQLNIIMEWSPGQIEAAGFNISEFIDDLRGMGLRSSEIKPDRVEEIPLEKLRNLTYSAGILLTK